MKYCPHCGVALDDTVLFCAHCKKEILESQDTNTQIDTNYDGYYDDILPEDAGFVEEGINRKLIIKVIIVCITSLLVISACVAALYLI